jgi:1-acyl-sn-glycerol-3-phosphate acyltransferase
MLRTIFFYALFFPSLLFGLLLVTALSLIDRSGRRAGQAARIWGGFVLRLAGVRLRTDTSALDPDQDYIFLCNHQSQMDIPVLYGALDKHLFGFLAKDSLFRIPILGRGMRALGCIPVVRGDGLRSMKSLRTALRRVGSGRSVVIFPEGTRNAELGPFKGGGIALALAAGKPIAPVVISGTGRLLPRGSLRLHPAEITVTALPPLTTQGRYTSGDRDALTRDLWTMMHTKLSEN